MWKSCVWISRLCVRFLTKILYRSLLLLDCKQSSLKFQITGLKSPKCVNMSRSSAYSVNYLLLNSSHSIRILKSSIFWREKYVCLHVEQWMWWKSCTAFSPDWHCSFVQWTISGHQRVGTIKKKEKKRKKKDRRHRQCNKSYHTLLLVRLVRFFMSTMWTAGCLFAWRRLPLKNIPLQVTSQLRTQITGRQG